MEPSEPDDCSGSTDSNTLCENSEDSNKTTKKMHKTSGYFRTVVAVHNLRDRAKEAAESLQERSLSDRVQDGWNKTRQAVSTKTRNFFTHPDNVQCEHIPQNYSYIFRPKSRWELVLLSGTVCGIEFCYAAETAFVTPILLSLGLNIKFVTMIWCLSPLIGFFLTPVLGSLSDSCGSRFGRRRPFILLLSLGILLGLIFVPNGHRLGIALGDTPHLQVTSNSPTLFNDTYTSNKSFGGNMIQGLTIMDKSELKSDMQTSIPMHNANAQIFFRNNSTTVSSILNETYSPYVKVSKRNVGKRNVQSPKSIQTKDTSGIHIQPWSITFTVLGTVLLDFCSDACQSPSRTYLLDVSLPEDHTVGLSTFTLMAGLGGSIGYLMGAVHWDETFLGNWLGGQVNVVFTIVTIVFIICLICTLSSFPEIPLSILKDPKVFREYQQKLQIGEYIEKGNELELIESKGASYGTTSASEELADAAPNAMPNGVSHMSEVKTVEPDDSNCVPAIPIVPALLEAPASTLDSEQPTLKEYLRSIIYMPKSLRILCLTNLFCWMSLVCYSLYFTDFVGEVVYGGDPQAPEGSELYNMFKDGVSFGCWGMALYSISCSVYSYFIEALVQRFGAKPVYIGGQLVYSVGMIIMAAARHPAAVILLSPTAGVMYSTLFTMPYLLIAHYHCTQKFRDDKIGGESGIRGIGTDVASVGSMVFLSQFILSLTMGSIVEAVGSNVATVCAAAILSACGAASATQVMYLDM